MIDQDSQTPETASLKVAILALVAKAHELLPDNSVVLERITDPDNPGVGCLMVSIQVAADDEHAWAMVERIVDETWLKLDPSIRGLVCVGRDVVQAKPKVGDAERALIDIANELRESLELPEHDDSERDSVLEALNEAFAYGRVFTYPAAPVILVRDHARIVARLMAKCKSAPRRTPELTERVALKLSDLIRDSKTGQLTYMQMAEAVLDLVFGKEPVDG